MNRQPRPVGTHQEAPITDTLQPRETTPAFVIAVEDVDDAAVLTITGELDAHTAPGLRQILGDLVDAGIRTVVLDMALVTFLDSTGLGVIVGGVRRLQACGGTLSLRSITTSTRRVLEITSLIDLVTIEDDI